MEGAVVCLASRTCLCVLIVCQLEATRAPCTETSTTEIVTVERVTATTETVLTAEEICIVIGMVIVTATETTAEKETASETAEEGEGEGEETVTTTMMAVVEILWPCRLSVGRCPAPEQSAPRRPTRVPTAAPTHLLLEAPVCINRLLAMVQVVVAVVLVVAASTNPSSLRPST